MSLSNLPFFNTLNAGATGAPQAAIQNTQTGNTTLTPDQLAQLKNQLHDINLPDAIQWWPPAPGWWVLLLLTTLLIVLGYLACRPRIKRWQFRRLLMRELKQIRRRYTRQDANQSAREKAPEIAIQGCAELLRRACLSHFPRQTVAGLSGQPWLAFLNSHTPTPCLTKTSTHLLTQQRFSGQPANRKKVNRLLKDMERWIIHFRPHSGSTGTPTAQKNSVKKQNNKKPNQESTQKRDQPQGARPA